MDLAKQRNRNLSLAVVVLATALIGLGIWAMLRDGHSTATAATSEINQLVDDYLAAANAYDADSWLAAVSDDFIYYQSPFHPIFASSSPAEHDATAEEIARRFHPLGQYPTNEFRWERLGEPIMTGVGPWNVSQAIQLTTSGYVLEGVTTLTIVDEDGTLKVAREVFVSYEIAD